MVVATQTIIKQLTNTTYYFKPTIIIENIHNEVSVARLTIKDMIFHTCGVFTMSASGMVIEKLI